MRHAPALYVLLTTLVNVRSTASRSKYIIADGSVAGKRTEKQTAGRLHHFQMHCLPAHRSNRRAVYDPRDLR